MIAITSGVKDMQAVLNLVWDKLLPALEAGIARSRRRGSQEARDAPSKGLTLRPQEGTGSPAKVAGKKYVFPANDRKLEAIRSRAAATGDDVTLVARFDGVDRRIACGARRLEEGPARVGPMFPEQPAAASGAWTGDDTYTARICFYETPFILTLTLKFDGDELLLDSESNVGFGPTRPPQLVGKAE